MDKTWDQMTAAEKIEDLRRDMLRTMQTVNAWTQSQAALGQDHHRLSNFVNGVAEAVKKVETKLG